MEKHLLSVVDLKNSFVQKIFGLKGLRLVFCKDQVCRAFFGLGEDPKQDRYLRKHFSDFEIVAATPSQRHLAKQLLSDFTKKDFFKRHAKHFYLGGTKFQQSVWLQIARVSFGAALSYGQLSVAVGRPKAVRAVGSACGKNPIPFFVPCHRILAKDGGLGGFGGGLPLKKNLLQFEKCV